MIQAVDDIHSFTAGFTFQDFIHNALVVAAVERKLEVIGEALKQMETYFPGSIAAFPDARPAMSVRNRLAHGYFDTDLQEIWSIVQNDLVPLKGVAATELAEAALDHGRYPELLAW